MDPDPDPQIHASDLWIRIRILDPDPAIFVIDLQDASKILIFNTIFSAYYFLKVHLHHFSKIKRQKESQNGMNQGFSYYYCMIEGSGSRAGSGSIPLTSGSGRHKNMWIRNTGILQCCGSGSSSLIQCGSESGSKEPNQCGFMRILILVRLFAYM